MVLVCRIYLNVNKFTFGNHLLYFSDLCVFIGKHQFTLTSLKVIEDPTQFFFPL